MQPVPRKRRRLPPQVTRQAARPYVRCTIGFRDVEQAPAQRGIEAGNRCRAAMQGCARSRDTPRVRMNIGMRRYCAVQPPSTSRLVPVTILASGEAR